MKTVLFDFKTSKEAWFDEASLVYYKKINTYCEFEIVHLKTLKQSRNDMSVKKKFEEDELLKKLNPDDFVILFDEMGRDLTSIEFSKQIEKIETSGKKRTVFIIGGAYGVSENVKMKVNLKISLSKFIMNHLVAEVVVLEQIYRAHTIINRIPYHNI